MRKIFTPLALLFSAVLAFPTVVSAQDLSGEPAFSFKSARGSREKSTERYVQVYLKSSEAGAKFYVVVDGQATEYDMVKAATLYNKKITVDKPEVDVKIYGKTISFINFNTTDAYDVNVGEDGKNTIAELRSEGNPITSIDFVNDMKALTYLYIGNNNKLTDVNIKSDVLERVKLNKQNKIKNFTMEGEKIYEFSLTNNNGIESVDFSKCPALTTVSLASDSAIKTVKFAENPQKLKSVTISYSQITEFAAKNMPALNDASVIANKSLISCVFENCPLLTRLNLANNGLETFTLSDMPKLTYLSLDGNPFQSLSLDLQALTTLYCDKTPLKSVDFSKLPKIKALYARNGVLESIQLSDEALENTLSGLYVTDNNFGLVDLPARGTKMKPSSSLTEPYNYYAPQKNPVLPTEVKVGDEIDLSKYLYAKLYKSDDVVNSVYKWVTKFDEELQEGVDYTVKDGVFKFNKAQEDSVACFITNTEFPWFKKYTDTKGKVYDYRLMTNYVAVNVATGVDAVEKSELKATVKSLAANEICVAGANGATVVVSDIAGRVLVNEAVSDDKTFAVPASGLYIVAVGNDRFKILVK